MKENDAAECGIIFKDERVKVVVLNAESWVGGVGGGDGEVAGGGDESVG